MYDVRDGDCHEERSPNTALESSSYGVFMNRFLVRLVSLLILPASIGHCQSQPIKARVASISFEPVKFDLPGNAKTLETWFRKAGQGGAKIAVAPEGALEGYVVNGIIAQDVDALRMREVADTIDSPTIKRFRDLARELDLCLVFGFAEKIAEDVFNWPSSSTTRDASAASIRRCNCTKAITTAGGSTGSVSRAERSTRRTLAAES